jgi:hypothetical protein
MTIQNSKAVQDEWNLTLVIGLFKMAQQDYNLRAIHLLEHWTVNKATWVWFPGGTWVWFPDGTVNFPCDWSWNSFYGHLHCTSTLTCTEVISSLLKWRQLVLINCLTACPGSMRWLNCALVNLMWLSNWIHECNQCRPRSAGTYMPSA